MVSIPLTYHVTKWLSNDQGHLTEICLLNTHLLFIELLTFQFLSELPQLHTTHPPRPKSLQSSSGHTVIPVFQKQQGHKKPCPVLVPSVLSDRRHQAVASLLVLARTAHMLLTSCQNMLKLGLWRGRARCLFFFKAVKHQFTEKQRMNQALLNPKLMY